MTQGEEVRARVKELIRELDELYSAFGRFDRINPELPYIDSKLITNLLEHSEFLKDVSRLEALGYRISVGDTK